MSHEHEPAMDGEGDAIIKQLERGLPRWEGFADAGWAGHLIPVSDWCFRYGSGRF